MTKHRDCEEPGADSAQIQDILSYQQLSVLLHVFMKSAVSEVGDMSFRNETRSHVCLRELSRQPALDG